MFTSITCNVHNTVYILLKEYSTINIFRYELQFISLRSQKLCLEMTEIYYFDVYLGHNFELCC
jgi:hypothetical protein